jgi:K+-sensing histidine kinase KdpD
LFFFFGGARGVGKTYRTILDLPDFAAGLDLSGAWGIVVEVLVGLI